MHTRESELTHHGILGMKWGVRRYQNADGTLTTAGRKRYGADVAKAQENLKKAKQTTKQAKDEYYKKTYGGLLLNKQATETLAKAVKEQKFAEDDVSYEKTKARLKSETKEKTKRRLQLENEYKTKGMSNEEAMVAAYKREKTEKILKVVAGVTVASLLAYGAYKYHDKNVDKIIKAGTAFQNISTDSNKGVKDAFYASFKSGDNKKYIGLYGNQLSTMSKDIYKTTTKATKDIKVASEKMARDTFKDLFVNDKIFAKDVTEVINQSRALSITPKQSKSFDKAIKSLDKGVVNKDVYNTFNVMLTNHTPKQEVLNQKFYKTLKDKGYDAIIDINDKRFSGYNSKAPIIAINGENTMSIKSRDLISSDAIDKAYNKEISKLIAKKTSFDVGTIGAEYGAVYAGGKYINNRLVDKKIQQYRKEHPNTKLTYREIQKIV